MTPPRPSRFRSLATAISRHVPRLVAINLVVALAVWWLGWPPLAWIAGTMALATASAAIIIAADFWTSSLPWRSLEQRGLKRNRDWLFRSVRYQLIDETVSERTIPLGCATFIVIIVTGFIATASGWLALATMMLIGSWAAVIEEKEQWPPVEAGDPSDPT